MTDIDGARSWFTFERWNIGDGTHIYFGNDYTSVYCVSDQSENEQWIAALSVEENGQITIRNGRAILEFTGGKTQVFISVTDSQLPGYHPAKFQYSRVECAEIIALME